MQMNLANESIHGILHNLSLQIHLISIFSLLHEDYEQKIHIPFHENSFN